jgi:hypothetical protein
MYFISVLSLLDFITFFIYFQMFQTTVTSRNNQYETDQNINVAQQKTHTSPTTEELMSSDGVLAVLEMGYSIETVRSAIDIWKISSHELEPSPLAIVDIILNNEELDSIQQISLGAMATGQDSGAPFTLANTMKSKKEGRHLLRNEIASNGSLAQESVPKIDTCIVTEKKQIVTVSRDDEGMRMSGSLNQTVVQDHKSASVTEPSSNDGEETSDSQFPKLTSALQREKNDKSGIV